MSGNREKGKLSCLSFAAFRVEQAVVKAVLEACEPLGIEASLKALEASNAQQSQKKRALELALERTRYEAERTRRQYEAVDPCNRLVAAESEARWNAALIQESEAQARLEAELESLGSFTQEQCERLRALSTDLPAAWNDPAAPVDLKKRILRTVIKEIVAGVNHGTENVEMRVHWTGGVHTALNVPKNRIGCNGRATDKDVIELVRELAKGYSDAYIAGILNRIGCQTGPGNSWNQTRVKNLRQHHQVLVFIEGAERPWITMAEAAVDLNVNIAVVRTMVKQGFLPARQIAKNAPWMIQREDLKRAEVQRYAKMARPGKPVPPDENNQPTLPYL